jgi:hypothetical protein
MPKAAIHAPTNVGRARAAAANNGSGYSVYDPVGQKIGIVERVFANPDGEPVYIRVRIGFCADPGTVRRDRREEKNPRPEVGVSCIQLKLKATRSPEAIWVEGLRLDYSST